MSGIAKKDTSVPTDAPAEVVPVITPQDILASVSGVSLDVAQSFASVLSDGVNAQVADFIAAPTLADAAGILAGAGWLASEATRTGQRSDRGFAVAVYALTSAKVMTGTEVAKALGRSPSGISHFVTEGMVYATLGLPEGWQDKGSTGIRSTDIAQLVANKSGEVRKVLGSSSKPETKRAVLARTTRKVLADRKAAQSQKLADAASAKAARTIAGKITDDLTLGFVESDADTKRHLSALVEACGYFGTYPESLKGADMATALAALSTTLGALGSGTQSD